MKPEHLITIEDAMIPNSAVYQITNNSALHSTHIAGKSNNLVSNSKKKE
jgi:hypothetical protein